MSKWRGGDGRGEKLSDNRLGTETNPSLLHKDLFWYHYQHTRLYTRLDDPLTHNSQFAISYSTKLAIRNLQSATVQRRIMMFSHFNIP